MVIVRTEKRVPTTWLGRHSHVSNDTKFHAIEGQEEGKLGSTYWPRIDEASKPKDTSHEWIQRIGRDGGRKGGRNGGKIAEILSENFFVSFSLLFFFFVFFSSSTFFFFFSIIATFECDHSHDLRISKLVNTEERNFDWHEEGGGGKGRVEGTKDEWRNINLARK